MTLHVLGISTSPRVNGNTDLLLRRALEGAGSTGAETEYINLSDYKIGLCTECNVCYQTGECKLNDDYQKVLKKLLETDRLIFATPVFFSTVCAQAKILIDRGQSLWVQKYVLKKHILKPERDRRAMVIAVGGSRSKKQFDGIRLTMKTYFDSLQMNYTINLFVNKVDDVGEIKKHPSAMDEAYRLGIMLVRADSAPPSKTIDIELL
jgi:multimeric flavodoxin WrbA